MGQGRKEGERGEGEGRRERGGGRGEGYWDHPSVIGGVSLLWRALGEGGGGEGRGREERGGGGRGERDERR
jgi:hypothetical protein